METLSRPQPRPHRDRCDAEVLCVAHPPRGRQVHAGIVWTAAASVCRLPAVPSRLSRPAACEICLC